MKKLLSFILIFVLMLTVMPTSIFTFTASAATSGYFTYTVTNGEATITACDTSISGDITIPSKLGGYQVTSIASRAFSTCSKITSVIIPDGVTEIGDYTFNYCTNLTSITIPDSVTNIGDRAFVNTKNITDVYISDIASWCNIDYYNSESYPLYNKKGNLYLNNTLIADLELPEGVTEIKCFAFMNCKNITSVKMPDSLTTIADRAFLGCISLKDVIFGENLATIGFSAFYGCTQLNNADFGENLSSLGDNAFSGCALTEIVIPDKVTTLKYSTFSACPNVKTLTIGKGLSKIEYPTYSDQIPFDFPQLEKITVDAENKSFSGEGNCLSQKGSTRTLILGCKNSVIPSDIKYIREYAFYNNLISKIVIPDSVVAIKNSAFENCTALSEVKIADSVTRIQNKAFYNTGYYNNTDNWENDALYIGNHLIDVKTTLSGDFTVKSGTKVIADYAFYACSNLTSITVPKSVTNIGDSAFQACSGMTSITLPFVGSNRDASETKEAPFGYIFGINSSTSSGGILQQYKNSTDGIISSDPNFDRSYYAKYYIPSNLKSVTITDDETISYGAFYNCTNITNIEIPGTTISIGVNAFYNCSSLESIAIPNGVSSIGATTFKNCTSLTSITLPDSITSIGNDTFYNTAHYNDVNNWENDVLYINNHLIEAKATLNGEYIVKDGTISIATYAFDQCNITSITMPDSLLGVGSYAFNGCTNLTAVYISDLKKWCEIDFASTHSNPLYFANNLYVNNVLVTNITVPEGATKIGSYAFSRYTRLTGITLPDSITSIGDFAFYKCSGLTTIDIPNNVTIIGDSAFRECTSLRSISLGAGIETIDEYALSFCSLITSITIPESVNFIGNGAFESCTGIKKVYISDLSKWCEIDFYDYRSNPTNFSKNLYLNGNLISDLTIPYGITKVNDFAFINCENLRRVYIPNTATSIGEAAFKNCRNITTVKMGSGVTTIGREAFYYCDKMSSLNLSTALVEIGQYSFEYCSALKSVFFPMGLEKIGYGAFMHCGSNLKNLTIPHTVTEISNYAFYDCSGITNVYYSATREDWLKISNVSSCSIPSTATIHYNYVYPEVQPDVQSPTATIRSLNRLSAVQSVLLSMSDDELVIGFYWGKSEDYRENISYMFGYPEAQINGLVEVAAPGTYYLTAFDSSHNVSETVSATFYKTTLDANGGAGGLESVITMEDDSFTPTEPTKEGYIFVGWATSPLSTSGSKTITAKANRTYYAVWEEIDTTKPTGSIRSTNNDASSQRVTLNLSDNKGLQGFYWGTNSDYNENDFVATQNSSYDLTVSTEGTYYLTVEDTSGNLSETVSVTFYKTTLDCKGGTARLSYLLTMSGNTSTLPTPTRTGYQFVGWTESENSGIYVETVTPTEDRTYYAVWQDTEKPSASISCTNNVTPTQTVTLNLSDNDGIAGYYWGTSNYYISNNFVSTSNNAVNLTMFVSGTYYLTVKDRAGNISETVSIRFFKTTLDARGGSVTPDTILTKDGNSITLPTPIRDGYEFDEWSSPGYDSNGNMTFTPVTDSVIYAFWFDKTRPTGRIYSTNDVAPTQTVTLHISDNEAVDGYYWGTNSYYASNPFVSGSNGQYVISSPGTYYLTVKDKSLNYSYTTSATFYQTTFDGNGGEIAVDSVLTKSGNSFTPFIPTREGYTFVGWSRYPNDTSGVMELTPESNDLYYAIWQDVTNPIGSITATNNVTPTQTVTLILSDGAGIAGFYWGKDLFYENNDYIVSDESSVRITVSEEGTYYLTVVDVNGNVSETVSATFYKTTFNANGGELNIDSVLTMQGNSFTMPIPQRDRYIFEGWVFSEDEDGIFVLTPDVNNIYIAKWSMDKPSTPENLRATLYGYDDVTLSWDAVEGANRYHVSYKKSSESNYTKAYIVIGTSYKFPNLADNTNYDFMVTAIVDDAGEMISSDPATITLKTSCALGKVSTFTATLYGHDDVELNWKAVAGATGYKVYYKKASAKNYTLKATTPALTYSIANLTDNCKYNFKIVPVATYGLTTTTGTAKAITYSTTKDLAAPKTLKASLYGYDDAKLTWSAVSGASRYKIYYKQSSADTYKYKTYTTKTTYNFANLYDGVSYDFKIVPCSYVNSTHFEADSFKTVTISSTINISAPTTFKAELYGYDDVQLSWSQVENAVAYKIYYKKSTSKAYTLKTTTTELTTKIWNLSDGIKYDFKVVPCTYVNGGYYADDSAKTASVYTLKKISTPTVTKHTAGKVKITWGNIQGETGYEISRSTSKTGTYIVSDYKTTTAKAKIISATKGKTYYYKVRAYKIVDGQKIYSPWSAVKAYKLK